MGVYSTVHVCLHGTAPLAPETRARVVELGRAHELLCGPCELHIVKRVEPEGWKEWLRARILRREILRNELVDRREAGPWIAEGVLAHTGESAVRVSSSGLQWKGEHVLGTVVYSMTRRAVPVEVSDAYTSPEERSPFAGDGKVGSFFDIVTIETKGRLDGRKLAASGFVKALKKELGLKVTCRTDWW